VQEGGGQHVVRVGLEAVVAVSWRETCGVPRGMSWHGHTVHLRYNVNLGLYLVLLVARAASVFLVFT
jgi:hypothetical protein